MQAEASHPVPHFAVLEPGSTVSLTSILSEFGAGDLFSATVNGTTLSNIGFVDGGLVLTSNAFTLPVDGTPNLTITDTFQLSGNLVAFQRGDDINPVLSTQLSGFGQVTLTLAPNQAGFYSLQSLTYEFQSTAPVPEPATVILLGTGLAGLAAGARRKARKLKRKGEADSSDT